MRRTLSASLFALGAMLLANVASATVMIPLSVEDLTARSAMIAHGRVVASQAAWGKDQRKIYTYTEIQVLSAVRGEKDVRTIVVRTLGGEVGDMGMKVSGTPRFTEGEEVFLFLRVDPLDRSQFQVVGMAQGKYRVEREGSKTIAVPSPEGLAFVRPSADGILRVSDEGPVTSRLPLGDLEARVRRAMIAPTSPTAPGAPTAPASTTVPKVPAAVGQ